MLRFASNQRTDFSLQEQRKTTAVSNIHPFLLLEFVRMDFSSKNDISIAKWVQNLRTFCAGLKIALFFVSRIEHFCV